MLADADAKLAARPGAQPPPAFTLRKFETNYIGTTWAKGTDDSSARMGSSSTAPPGTQPRIEVKLTVTTTVDDAQPFMAGTLDPWLRSHVERPGVPYKLILPDNIWRNPSIATVGGASTGLQPPTPGEGVAPPPERGPGRAPSSGRGQQTPRGPAGEGGGGGGGGGDDGDMGPRPPGAELFGPLAPLPDFRPKPPAGATTLATFELTWSVELLPPAGAKENGS
jgi:hypothetical protein